MPPTFVPYSPGAIIPSQSTPDVMGINDVILGLMAGTLMADKNSLKQFRKLGFTNFVASGCTVAQPTNSLTTSVAPGIVVVNGEWVSIALSSYAYPVNSRCYVWASDQGVITINTTASTATTDPATLTNADGTDQIILAIIATDATKITAVQQWGVSYTGKYIYNREPAARPISVFQPAYVSGTQPGGTFFYRTQNGVKEMWGYTGNCTFGNGSNTLITGSLPPGFFNQAITMQLNAQTVGNAGMQTISGNGTNLAGNSFTFYGKADAANATCNVAVYIRGF